MFIAIIIEAYYIRIVYGLECSYKKAIIKSFITFCIGPANYYKKYVFYFIYIYYCFCFSINDMIIYILFFVLFYI